MLDQEKINRFIEETLNEMRDIDARLEQAKAAAAELGTPEITPEQRQQAQALLEEAKAQAEAEGSRRRTAVSISADAPRRSGSRRARTLI